MRWWTLRLRFKELLVCGGEEVIAHNRAKESRVEHPAEGSPEPAGVPV